MSDLTVIVGGGNNQTSPPQVGASFFVVRYFKSFKDGDSGWQQSVSDIYPTFRFQARDTDNALKLANAFAHMNSQGRVGYEIKSLYQVQEINIPSGGRVVDIESIEDRIKDGVFMPF